MDNEDIFSGFGIEVKLEVSPQHVGYKVEPKEAYKDAFLKVKETLTRIGIASRRENVLWQSCHILHKRGQYAILHFKELFALDGKSSNFSEDDRLRRNKIAALLEEWGLLKVVAKEKIKEQLSLNQIKILHFSKKKDWRLYSKYQIGQK